ncbi:MAG TPA: hypothetical protein RMF84_10630 [Polyangiaceae bacterium LLY-WYZ-14_1]|nr:hypothetical protein [Polyangiaceae bacterium LLY-WYZ-14_1]
MTRRTLSLGLAVSALLILAAGVATAAWSRIPAGPSVPASVQRWVFAALAPTPPGVASRAASAPPEEAEGIRAEVVLIDRFVRGRRRDRVVSRDGLVDAVARARETWGSTDARADDDAPRVEHVVTLVDGEGPIVLGVPFLTQLEVVPVHEGLVGRFGDEAAYLTPSDLAAEGAYDGAVDTPVPDLSFGLDVPAARARLARALDAPDPEAVTLRRIRARTLLRTPYPNPEPARLTPDLLRNAALDGARFLLRHQRPSGRTTYRFDARRGRAAGGFSLTRHAGSTWFLAQAATLGDHAPSRQGARNALRWIERSAVTRCGADEEHCVAQGGVGSVGPTALTALAAAELLVGGPDAEVEALLRGLTAFLRAQQRPDGELMHGYDLRRQEPIDVQQMFFSGEAALALLRAHDALGDPRDLATARRLLSHLTGAGWDFFGSRYYYGTEHWTCLSVGAAWERAPSPEGIDFCRRWADWNERLQFEGGDSPWEVAGAFGAGPLVVPRLTHAATNAEGMISIYEVGQAQGRPDPSLAGTIEATLRLLLRWRFAPGPTHLFDRPEAAFGGIPESPASTMVRNDYVQHAGSALLRWAELLDAR